MHLSNGLKHKTLINLQEVAVTRVGLLTLQQDIIDSLPDEYDIALTPSSVTIEYDGVTTEIRPSVNSDMLRLNPGHESDKFILTTELRELLSQLTIAYEIKQLLGKHGYKPSNLTFATTEISRSHGRITGWAIFVNAPAMHSIPFCIHVPALVDPGIVMLDKTGSGLGIDAYNYPDTDPNSYSGSTAAEMISLVLKHKPLSGSLEEGRFKQAVAAGAIAASALTGGSVRYEKPPEHTSAHVSQTEHDAELKRKSFKNFSKSHDSRAKELATTITSKYSIKAELALKVATLAIKHEKPTFPKAEDILAICGIESSFKPHAVSQLKNDPAVGLMQVRPAVWKLDKEKLQGSVEEQIKTGAEILHGYYTKLKSKDSAIQAYNVGITNYMKKKGLNPRYVPKFKNEREMYEGLSNARKAMFALQQMFTNAFDDFDTELVHLEAEPGYKDRYRMKLHTPWADLWVDLDSEQEWQKVSFGVGNKSGGANTNETYNFHSEAELLDFVKTQYNRYIAIKTSINAPIGLSGRRIDWSKYILA